MQQFIPARVIILCFGLVLAYLGVWFGDVVLSKVLAVICFGVTVICGAWYIEEGSIQPRGAILATVTLVVAALAFGWVAEPVTNFGFLPFFWGTPWLLWLVLGMIPMVLETVELCSDIQLERVLRKPPWPMPPELPKKG